MVIALVTLAVLLIGAAATMRSMNVSLLNTGNIGFKRDMANQSERAIRSATDSLLTGGLASAAARMTSNPALNYSATMLPSDATGIPLAMLNMTDRDAFGGIGNAARAIKLPDDGIEMHYMIDRLCLTPGVFTTANCSVLGRSDNAGYKIDGPKILPQATFRITVRVTGPHNAYSFYQTTYSVN